LQKKFKKDLKNLKGMGAAGGVALGLKYFLDNVEIVSGATLLFEISGLKQNIKNFNIVITGEGQIDSQTINGKVVKTVAEFAKKYNLKVIAICGTLGDGYELMFSNGVDYIMNIIEKPMEINEVIENSYDLVMKAGMRIGYLIKNFKLV